MEEINKIELVTDLLVGEGAEDFRQVGLISNVFCPFEAIGMVHQEIMHAKFLSFIFDENRPHAFGSKALEELLGIIVERTENIPGGLTRLDLHFMDVANTLILREWRNIDLLIEIPGNSEKKGVVVAIELKIHAGESSGQLLKYQKVIEAEYDSNEWQHILVFLTLNEDEPSNESWIPIGVSELVARLEKMMNSNEFRGQSSDLLNSYTTMMRRNFMSDETLKLLARKIWAKHKEALNILYYLEPDLRGEAMEVLYDRREAMAKVFSAKTGLEFETDKSQYGLLRFTVKSWDKYSQMLSGDGQWLDTKRLMAIELGLWGKESVRMSFVIGPGEEEFRSALFEQVLKQIDKGILKIGRRTPVSSTKHKHLSASYVLSKKRYLRAVEEQIDAVSLAEEIERNSIKFLLDMSPKYEKIISKAFK